MELLPLLNLFASLALMPLGVLIVRRFSQKADGFEQMRFSPWLANFEEYSRHAVKEGCRPIKPDEDRAFYIRHVESERARRRV